MTRLFVPDMSCGHCKASVETALSPLTTRVEVDLSTRQVVAEGSTPETLLAALNRVGFPASVVE